MEQIRAGRRGEEGKDTVRSARKHSEGLPCQLPSPSPGNTPLKPRSPHCNPRSGASLRSQPHVSLESQMILTPVQSFPSPALSSSNASQLNLFPLCQESSRGGGYAWAESRDIVSIGLAAKYQRQAGSSLQAGFKNSQEGQNSHSEPGCIHSPCQPGRRGEPSLSRASRHP